MALLFSDVDPAQLFASPLRAEAPSVDVQLDELFNYDGPMMDDWLVGSQGSLPVDARGAPTGMLLPLSSDAPPSGSIPSSSGCNIENVGTGQSNNGSDGTHSSDALNVRDVDSFGAHAPSTLLPSHPSTKKRKIRPEEKLQSLQQQLDDVMAQVEQLTLVNERLHCKNVVLTSLLESSDEVELISAFAPRQLEACIRDPAGHHSPVILTMHSLTPQTWLAFYNGKLAEISHLLISCGDVDQLASDEPMKMLTTLCKRDLLVHLLYGFTVKREVMLEVKRITYEQFAHKHREEEFWGEVVRSLVLTPAQEQRIVLACEIYERCMSRLAEQREGPGGSIGCQVEACSAPAGPRGESLLEQVTSNLVRCQHLIRGLANWLYGTALTPLQAAQCFLHAHPILPNPVLMLTAIAHVVRARGARPPPRRWSPSRRAARSLTGLLRTLGAGRLPWFGSLGAQAAGPPTPPPDGQGCRSLGPQRRTPASPKMLPPDCCQQALEGGYRWRCASRMAGARAVLPRPGDLSSRCWSSLAVWRNPAASAAFHNCCRCRSGLYTAQLYVLYLLTEFAH